MNLEQNPFEFFQKLSDKQKSQYFFAFFCFIFLTVTYVKDWTFERWMISIPSQLGLPFVWLMPSIGIFVYVGVLLFQFVTNEFALPFLPISVVSLYLASVFFMVLGKFASTKKLKKSETMKTFLICLFMLLCVVSVWVFNTGYPEPGLNLRNWDLTHNVEIVFIFLVIVLFIRNFSNFKTLYWLVVFCGFVFSLRGFRRFFGSGFGLTSHFFGFTDSFMTGYENNAAALIILTIMPLAVYLLFSEKHVLQKIQSAVISVVMFFTVLIPTRSRGGWLGLAFVTFVLLVKRIFKPTTWAILILGIFLVPATIPFLPQEVSDRFKTFSQLEQGTSAEDVSIKARAGAIVKSIELIKAQPFFGYGLGNSENELGGLATHNIYLELGVELGITGLLVYLAILAVSFIEIFLAKRLLRMHDLKKHPAYFYLDGIQVGMIGFVVSSTFLSAQWQPIIWILFGMSSALYGIVKTEIVPNKGVAT